VLNRAPSVQRSVHGGSEPTIGSIGLVVAHAIEDMNVSGDLVNVLDLGVKLVAQVIRRRLLRVTP
jgi:hypothetical protein